MNWWLMAAGLLSAVVAGVHIVAGHVDPVRPLLASGLADVPKRTLHAVWHMVSVDLVLAAAALISLAVATPVGTSLAAVILAAHFLGYTVVFLVCTLALPGPGRLLRLPQWMLLLPVAALALVGSL